MNQATRDMFHLFTITFAIWICTAGVSSGEPEASQNIAAMTYSKITINVERHPEVSGEYMVGPNGVIEYDFVGDVSLNHMTADQITAVLKQRLSEYIVDPDVTVNVVEQPFVYVAGEMPKAGKTPIDSDSITISELLELVGPPLPTASLEKAYILRLISKNRRQRIRVDLKKLLHAGDVRENKQMLEGDILYVPATNMANQKRVNQLAPGGDLNDDLREEAKLSDSAVGAE